MEKKFLSNFKVAGVISVVFGVLCYTLFSTYGLISIGLGALMLYFSTQEISYLRKKTILILILGILMVFINVLSAIFIFIGYDQLVSYLHNNKDPIDETKEVVSDEVKKIDLLLKLGTFMVLASGVLFATTSWYSISNLFKLLFLLVLGTVFLCLSIFVENKLKIEKTTFAYWLLGISFYFLIWVGICYFKVFGDIFSYTGVLKDLAYLTTYLLASILLFITSLKFDMKKLLYLVYIGLYISIYYFIRYIGIEDIINIIILSVLNIICNIILIKNKDSILRQVIKLISFAIVLLVFKNISSSDDLYVFMASVLNILNMFILLVNNDDVVDNVLGFISIYIYLYLGTVSQGIVSEKNFLFISMASVVTIFAKLFKEKKPGIYITNQVIYHLTAISFYISTFFVERSMLIPISVIYLVTTFINSLNINKLKTKSIDYYLEPLPVAFVAISIMYEINKNFFSISFILGLSIITMCYLLLHIIGRNKEEYLVMTIVGIIITTCIIAPAKEIIPGILVLLTSLILFLKNYLKENKNSKEIRGVLYTVILINIDILLNIINIDRIIGCVLALVIYVGLLLLFKKERVLEIITNIIIILPMYQLINYYVVSYELSMVLENALEVYALYVLIKYIFSKAEFKNVISIIGIIAILSQIVFEHSVYVGVYVGIVGILTIMVGYFDKKQKGLFQTGIIITVINIIYQLIDIWQSIPFWLYLLLAGLGLIGFVTYKEMNRDNKKKEVADIPNNPKNKTKAEKKIKYCSYCGSPNSEDSKFCSNCGKEAK